VLDFHYRKTTKESYKEFQMQILRFDDEGVKAPSRKKSSRSLLILGLVGALFGISSAFASSTIDINGNNRVNLGQGVVKVSGCDLDVSVVPSTKMIVEVATGPTFYLDKIVVSNVDTRTATEATNFDGCGGKTFDLQIFDPAKVPYTCGALNAPLDFSVTYELSSTETLTPTPCGSSTLSFTMPSESTFSTYKNPEFTLHFNKAPSDISYITLVSKS